MFCINRFRSISIKELGKLQYIYEWISTRKGGSIIMIILIFSSLVYGNKLSAFPSLKPSAIDNKYDIPIAIPIETNPNNLPTYPRASPQIEDHTSEILAPENHPSTDAITTLATCEKPAVSGVTANGNDGNIPSNAIDNNLNTRWSNNGVGSWIQLDLGSRKNICSVDIAWYRGDQRTNNFIISVSDDGNSFRDVITTSSTTGTTTFQSYSLPAGTEGRYVRITVNGNSEGTWASINEITVTSSEQSHTITPGPLFHKSQTPSGSNTWSSWGSLGGAIRSNSDVSLAMNSDGRLQAFVVDTNNALYYKTQSSPNSNIWSSSWTSLGGGIKADTSPAVAMNNDGRLQVFVVGTNNQLYCKTQSSPNSNIWSSSWTSLGGGLRANTDPIGIANNDGRLQVFVVGTNNQLYYKTQSSPNSNTWSSAWTSLGGGIKADTSPAVAMNNDGRLQVFAVGTNNQLQYRAQTAAGGSSTWSSAWTSLGGGLRANTDPIGIANNDGRLQVFVVGTNNAAILQDTVLT